MELPELYQRSPATWKAGVIDFINALKSEPEDRQIKLNKFADNSKYLPIGYVEEKLDYYFNLWKTTDFQWSVVVNEIVCSIQLHVFNPIAGMWIERTGTAAVQIQLSAQYEVIDGKRVKKPVDVMDVSKKIANTLQKDFPHAKAEAIKNAAKSLGNIFGRNLNRDIEDQTKENISLEDAEIQIQSIDDKMELNKFYKDLPSAMRDDIRIRKALKDQEQFIKNNKSNG